MPHARVEVHVRQVDDPDGVPLLPDGRWVKAGPAGLDEVELRLAANAGAEPRPLIRGASGGELSRVMLSLEVALAGTTPVPTFVFDEVDAGIGGAAAVEVGRRLGLLARHAQVLVVTHLPQVAAFADRHVVVVKSADGSVTSSGLEVLDEQGRLRELSRMLAGFEESEAARAHARELLAAARERVA
jgi:DNA repair protein RecN (Recombination protein N)